MVSYRDRQSQWLATCPKGLESLLASELESLGALDVKQTVAAVYFAGTQQMAYRVCLWSRLANRILLSLDNFSLDSVEHLYDRCGEIPWEQHFGADKTIAVDFSGTSQVIDNSIFGAQRIKDAIVDRLRRIVGERPSVDLKNPQMRIQARLHRGRVSVALDMSGASLHRRGYRSGQGSAPLKENLAAALLLRAGWTDIAAAGGALIDPMCGSGTLLIEAAMMAADVAPGLLRPVFGFHSWAHHDDALWSELVTDAEARRDRGIGQFNLDIRGYDANPRVLEAARLNIEASGFDDHLRVALKPLDQFGKASGDSGLLITNPPYGARLGDAEQLEPLYQKLGAVLQKNFHGWRAAMFTGNLDLARQTDLSPSRQYQFYNGTIPCKLLLFDDMRSKSAQIRARLATPAPVKVLSEGAQMLANRLVKNRRRLAKWLASSGSDCYRLYDADLPEYAVAIDVYGGAFHVQEYVAPASIDERDARQRFAEVKDALANYAPQAKQATYYKERRRQRGDDQYQRIDDKPSQPLIVTEGDARFEVNLGNYLDTGLFLDHRPLRARLADEARGKRFLNLFCYTASASVQVALAGAASSLSCDMSNTYLDWAARNYDLNQLSPDRHRLLRVDCLEWLQPQDDGESELYDLILLDPPTFSNSKKMQSALDVQRDHGHLIRDSMAKLAPGGSLYFSNNFRKFKLDDLISRQFAVENITADTLDVDFQRNPRIHNVWHIQRRAGFQG